MAFTVSREEQRKRKAHRDEAKQLVVLDIESRIQMAHRLDAPTDTIIALSVIREAVDKLDIHAAVRREREIARKRDQRKLKKDPIAQLERALGEETHSE